MREVLSGIPNLVSKEFRQMRRDPFRIRVLLLAPLVQLLLLGYAANLDVRDVPLVVHDMDRTPASRELVDRFVGSGYFTLRGYAAEPSDIDRAIERGDAAVALVIPQGFGAAAGAGRTAPLQMIADGSDGAFAARGINYAGAIVARYGAAVALEHVRPGLEPAPPIEARVTAWFNPGFKSQWFFVPGILALILMIVTMVGTAVGVVREKEGGTLEQLNVTPIRPTSFILGKLILSGTMGMLEVVLVLGLVLFVFQVPIHGSVLLLIALCALFLLCTLGLGLFISTVSRTQQQAMLASIFFVMMPMLLLSGFVFPIENMPEPIQWFTYLIPLRYFFIIIRGIMLKGVGLEMLWDEALALLVFGVVILALSVWRMRKRIA
jgi:ABC-2 type transport system permease protein